MNRREAGRPASWRTALAAGAAVLAATAPAGCAAAGTHSDALPPKPHLGHSSPASSPTAAAHVVVYRVTGRGRASSITYRGDGASAAVRLTGVRLPWSRTLRLPGGSARYAVSLVVGFDEIGGVTHQDSITVDGRVLARGSVSGTGSGHSDLSGGFGG